MEVYGILVLTECKQKDSFSILFTITTNDNRDHEGNNTVNYRDCPDAFELIHWVCSKAF